MNITKHQILEKSHQLISEMSGLVWDSVNESDKEDDRLALAYVNGVCELSDSLIKLLDEPINTEECNELAN